jgi:pyruvate/2-oxoglutarate dehydrogenase complex dihydrolipoamide dehydrogenase (E3) component
VDNDIEKVDLLVIGSGPAGKALALDRATAGERVTLVERDMLGGSCDNVSCAATKSLVASARAVRAARRAEELGILAEDVRIDLDLVRQHENRVVRAMVAKTCDEFSAAKVEVVKGIARFISPRTALVQADGHSRTIRGHHTVIDTGSVPDVPDIPGLLAARPWTSSTAITLPMLPERLVIIGGGQTGCEFAQVFTALGTRVTIVEHGPRLLNDEDEDIAAALTGVFEKDGITVRAHEEVEWIERDADGAITVRLVDGGDLPADEILLATGRKPASEHLGLEHAKVSRTDGGFVEVDEHLRTTAKRTWAAGDVAGTPMYTHAALDDYRVIKSDLDGPLRSTRDRLIPYTVFTTPELGRAGLTEQQARAAGHDVEVKTLPVAGIPRARTDHDIEGLWKAVLAAGTGRILGASILGPQAGEVITTIHLAMLAGIPGHGLRDAIICHPAVSEGLNLLFNGPVRASAHS